VRCSLINAPLGYRFPQAAGYARVQERPQIKKPGDRKAWDIDNLDRCSRRIDHPGWNEKGRLVACAQGQMPTAVVELIGDHDRKPPKQRVERIGDR
jgi:hypothetical protein